MQISSMESSSHVKKIARFLRKKLHVFWESKVGGGGTFKVHEMGIIWGQMVLYLKRTFLGSDFFDYSSLLHIYKILPFLLRHEWE